VGSENVTAVVKDVFAAVVFLVRRNSSNVDHLLHEGLTKLFTGIIGFCLMHVYCYKSSILKQSLEHVYTALPCLQ